MPDTSKTIEQYIEELRRFKAAAIPAPREAPFAPIDTADTVEVTIATADETDPPETADTPEETATVDEANVDPVYILAKDFRREYWNPTDAETGTGFLQVRVSSGRDALPIAGARVVVSRPESAGNGNRLVLTTNVDGMTSFIALPTVDKALSQSPAATDPFSTYSIRTEAPDQLTVIHLHVPIFDGVSSIQRVDMVGPEENYSGDGVILFNEQSPRRLSEE